MKNARENRAFLEPKDSAYESKILLTTVSARARRGQQSESVCLTPWVVIRPFLLRRAICFCLLPGVPGLDRFRRAEGRFEPGAGTGATALPGVRCATRW